MGQEILDLSILHHVWIVCDAKTIFFFDISYALSNLFFVWHILFSQTLTLWQNSSHCLCVLRPIRVVDVNFVGLIKSFRCRRFFIGLSIFHNVRSFLTIDGSALKKYTNWNKLSCLSLYIFLSIEGTGADKNQIFCTLLLYKDKQTKK